MKGPPDIRSKAPLAKLPHLAINRHSEPVAEETVLVSIRHEQVPPSSALRAAWILPNPLVFPLTSDRLSQSAVISARVPLLLPPTVPRRVTSVLTAGRLPGTTKVEVPTGSNSTTTLVDTTSTPSTSTIDIHTPRANNPK